MLILHLFGHVITLNGWQATVATAVLAFHDIVLYPIVFILGRIFGKKTNKPKRLTKRSELP